MQIRDELNNRPGIAYSIAETTVRRDYEANIVLWNEKALTPTGADVQMQKERLRLTEVEAWAAWERSKSPAETIKQIEEMKDLIDEDGEIVDQVLAIRSVEKLLKSRVGDERFLRIVLDCWDKRARLDGQYAAAKIDVSSRHEEKHEYSFKMFKGVGPEMWEDGSIEVIDGEIVKDGEVVEIIDGVPRLKSGKTKNSDRPAD